MMRGGYRQLLAIAFGALLAAASMFCASPAHATCSATSCKVVPCSVSESGENGAWQSDDARGQLVRMPVGCDDQVMAP